MRPSCSFATLHRRDASRFHRIGHLKLREVFRSMHPTARRGERGFTLLETAVVLMLVSAGLIAFVTLGPRPPRAHAAALSFSAAIAETRALAMANAGVPEPGGPSTGATLSVVQTETSSIAYVYRSRPIPGSAPLVRDAGLPPFHLGAVLTLPNATKAPQPFSIFVSSAGYASIAPNFAYDPREQQTLPSDPGCDETGVVAITATAGNVAESHPLECRFTAFAADVPLDAATLATANASIARRAPIVPSGPRLPQ